MKSFRKLTFALALFGTFIAHSVFAETCATSDASGTWSVFGSDVSNKWTHCTMVFSPTGQLDPVLSECKNQSGKLLPDFSSGSLSIDGTCKVTGTINLIDNVVTIVDGEMDQTLGTITTVVKTSKGKNAIFHLIKRP